MTELARALDSLVPPFDDSEADWPDAVRRGDEPRRGRRPVVAVLAASLALAAVLAATPLGHAVVGSAFDRMSAWIGTSPGGPAPPEEQRLLRQANARAAAPIPSGAELGLLTSQSLDGVGFDLLGFRDRGSLCLRLRSSAGQGEPIVKAPADCVSEQLLIDLGKPIAVVAAADPFPRAKSGLQALYGLAADRVAAVELSADGGVHRIRVENNSFLYLYRGEGPRLAHDRLEYKSDVPSRALALDASGRALGFVKIMSLKRGYPGAPALKSLPGPSVVERRLDSPRVGWLERGEQRGDPYDWRLPGGSAAPGLAHLRMFRPSPITSMRVLVAAPAARSLPSEAGYCLANVWPLSPRPTGAMCGPTRRFGAMTLATATAVPFDAQFPIFYGLVADEVASLDLFLSNGVRESIPVTDNVFALQASAADPAKLVAYDEQHRVLGIRVVSVG